MRTDILARRGGDSLCVFSTLPFRSLLPGLLHVHRFCDALVAQLGKVRTVKFVAARCTATAEGVRW
jgi:hypothetical protein